VLGDIAVVEETISESDIAIPRTAPATAFVVQNFTAALAILVKWWTVPTVYQVKHPLLDAAIYW
jgi:hypothetical protein